MSNLAFDKVDNEQGEIASISNRAVSADLGKGGKVDTHFKTAPLFFGGLTTTVLGN